MSSEEVSAKHLRLSESNLTEFSDRLRCDRNQPCLTCTARGLALSCAYPNNQAPQSPRPHGAHRARPQATVQDRLGQLEQIVVSLMQKTTDGQDRPDQHPVASAPQDGPQEDSPGLAINTADSPAQSDGGSVWFSSSDAQYVGGTHWAAILDGIADIKEQLEQEDYGNTEKPAMLHTFLLYGCKSASKEDILAALPDRPAVDRYISQYFNRLDLAPCKPLPSDMRTMTNTGIILFSLSTQWSVFTRGMRKSLPNSVSRMWF